MIGQSIARSGPDRRLKSLLYNQPGDQSLSSGSLSGMECL